jgi:hypothetical protein
MPKTISSQLASHANDVRSNHRRVCVTHIEQTPCWSGAIKYTITSSGFECSDLVIMYADAAEHCMRESADARFWAGIAYSMTIVVALSVFVSCVGMGVKMVLV